MDENELAQLLEHLRGIVDVTDRSVWSHVNTGLRIDEIAALLAEIERLNTRPQVVYSVVYAYWDQLEFSSVWATVEAANAKCERLCAKVGWGTYVVEEMEVRTASTPDAPGDYTAAGEGA